MPTESFKASRWTKGNWLFPTEIEVSDASVTWKKRGLITKNEMNIHIQKVASVKIKTGILWSDILIETSGADQMASHGHNHDDALRIKTLIESAQSRHVHAPPAAVQVPNPEPTKTCPYCAETIKTAAKICRFCNRELSAG